MWQAASACQRIGFSEVELDMGSALAMATAAGCGPKLAAELLTQFAYGMREGMADLREQEGEP